MKILKRITYPASRSWQVGRNNERSFGRKARCLCTGCFYKNRLGCSLNSIAQYLSKYGNGTEDYKRGITRNRKINSMW